MSEWTDATLGEVLTLQRGFDITRNELREGAVPVVSSSGIAYYHDEAKVSGPGVVVGRKGSLGKVHFLQGPFWPHDTTLWVKDFKGNYPYFCYLLLNTLRLEELDVGAANPTLNRNHAHHLRVKRPDLESQHRIAAVFSAVDRLIQTNERRIEILEDLARSLYREWFVHFRLPGRVNEGLVESDAGPVPKGWSPRQLAEFAEVVADGVDPSEFEPSDAYVGLEHLSRRSTTLQEWGSAETVRSRKLRVARGDTLFGKIRPNLHKVAWAPFQGLASSDTVIMRPRQGLTGFVNALVSSDRFVAEAVATANGTKMPRADTRAMLAYEVVAPDTASPLLRQFNEAVERWLSWSGELVQVNQMLVATRDLLLPRLVTGQLDISDVDLGVLTSTEPE